MRWMRRACKDLGRWRMRRWKRSERYGFYGLWFLEVVSESKGYISFLALHYFGIQIPKIVLSTKVPS